MGGQRQQTVPKFRGKVAGELWCGSISEETEATAFSLITEDFSIWIPLNSDTAVSGCEFLSLLD